MVCGEGAGRSAAGSRGLADRATEERWRGKWGGRWGKRKGRRGRVSISGGGAGLPASPAQRPPNSVVPPGAGKSVESGVAGAPRPAQGSPRGLRLQCSALPHGCKPSNFGLNKSEREGSCGAGAARFLPPARAGSGLVAAARRSRGRSWAVRGQQRGGGGRRAPAPREGKSFRPRSERLRSFGRARRRQSQANTAPAWARCGAAAGAGARARRGPWGKLRLREGEVGYARPPGGGAVESGLLRPAGSPGNTEPGSGDGA